MENFNELALSEMVDVSGGNLAYDLGHSLGKAITGAFTLYGIYTLVLL